MYSVIENFTIQVNWATCFRLFFKSATDLNVGTSVDIKTWWWL